MFRRFKRFNSRERFGEGADRYQIELLLIKESKLGGEAFLWVWQGFFSKAFSLVTGRKTRQIRATMTEGGH